MSTVDFKSRTFDFHKFMTMPRCKGEYKGSSGEGCLFTAFLYAMDYEYVSFASHTSSSGITSTIPEYVKDRKTNSYVRFYELITEFVRLAGIRRISEMTSKYDNGSEKEALDVVFRVIDQLPNKINYTPESLELIIPETCSV